MSNRLAQIVAAKFRLSRMEPDDIRIIGPLLDDLERDASGGRIEFIQDGQGFIIDGIKFRNLIGLTYIHALLDRAHNSIAAKKLDPIPGDVMRQELIDRDALTDMVDEAKEIRRSMKYSKGQPELHRYHEKKLAEINLVLQQVSHGGRPKHFTDELERCRQRVRRNINRAIVMLWTHPDDRNLHIGPRREHPQTSYIAKHLREKLETGHSCIYKGLWRWKTR